VIPSYVLIVSLAVFSITYFLRYMEGPFDIFLRFRKMCGIVYTPVLDSDGLEVDIIEEVVTRQFPMIARLVSCYWCLTAWVSFIVFLVYAVISSVILWFPVMWFAGITVSGLLCEYIWRGK